MLALWHVCLTTSFTLVTCGVGCHRVEAREDSGRLLGRVVLILRYLSLIPARELFLRLSTKVLHVYNVLELGDQLVTLSAVQHQLGARVRLISRLKQLQSLFLSHVLIKYWQYVDTKLCWCSL